MAQPQDLLSSARQRLARWEYEEAEHDLYEGLLLARERCDLHCASECLCELAGLGATTGEGLVRTEALRLALEAAEGFHTLGLPAREGAALYWAGTLSDGSTERAEHLLSSALALLAQDVPAGGEFAFCCRVALGDLALDRRGDAEAAEAHYRAAWELLPRASSRLALPRLAQSLARVALLRGEPARAAAYVEQALAALGPLLATGARVQEAECRVLLGEACACAGDVEGARRAYELALEAFAQRSARARVEELEARLRTLAPSTPRSSGPPPPPRPHPPRAPG